MDYLVYFVIVAVVLIEVVIFTLCVRGLSYLIKVLKRNSNDKYLDVKEYLPEEEIHTLRQVYYLIMMTLLVINLIALFVILDTEVYYYIFFEFFISIIVCEGMPKETIKDKLILLTLVPFTSMMIFLTGEANFVLIDFIRIIGLLYGIKFYYGEFARYTANNSLGHTILLLFAIIFFSLFFTNFTEGTNLLDALVMVSNAFTSNGYAILGGSIPGKINAIFLVWSGYILSGVGTATLTATLLIKHYDKIIKHYDKKFEELEESIKELNKK